MHHHKYLICYCSCLNTKKRRNNCINLDNVSIKFPYKILILSMYINRTIQHCLINYDLKERNKEELLLNYAFEKCI
jgi:hypothetical protein